MSPRKKKDVIAKAPPIQNCIHAQCYDTGFVVLTTQIKGEDLAWIEFNYAQLGSLIKMLEEKHRILEDMLV